ncbi:LysR family transcriptional regulator [Streptomyces sp. N2-109]|uniref:LysR family transcriptional regulator n=1 Tax=Streptomyces gossypii TaxID=2883101 RepID=A0ABT2JM13_9ACTN|nr:LysR family transcriptional regulator [Streptomyces gossypii]MCT2588921.1 LysR family transcriptional regulator [Streptomyces gossypii]
MIDLGLLQTFRVLQEQGTVTAAARTLSLSPSAVSQQLRQLSRQAGAELLEPDGRRLRLTATGRVLLRHADVMCAQWEEARAELAQHGAPSRRTLRLAGFATSVGPLLAPAAEDLLHAARPTQATVTETDTRGCYQQLLANRVDIAVLTPLSDSPPIDDARFHQEPLLEDVLDLVVPAHHRLATQEGVDLSAAERETWISPHHDQDRLTHALCTAAGFAPRTVHHADEWHAVLALVSHGLGVCLVPRLISLDAHPRAVRLPLKGDPPPSRRILTCVRRGSSGQSVVSDGLKALRARAEQEATTTRPGCQR